MLLTKYRLVLLALILVTLVTFPVLAEQARMDNLNRSINLENSFVVRENVVANWDNGVANISASFGPVPTGSGILYVSWNSPEPLTFYVEVLRTTERATSGSARLPFVNPPETAPTQVITAWFHNGLPIWGRRLFNNNLLLNSNADCTGGFHEIIHDSFNHMGRVRE
jgi:hypothetical protein